MWVRIGNSATALSKLTQNRWAWMLKAYCLCSTKIDLHSAYIIIQRVIMYMCHPTGLYKFLSVSGPLFLLMSTVRVPHFPVFGRYSCAHMRAKSMWMVLRISKGSISRTSFTMESGPGPGICNFQTSFILGIRICLITAMKPCTSLQTLMLCFGHGCFKFEFIWTAFLIPWVVTWCVCGHCVCAFFGADSW